jgi:glycosyltransferase involved in cell wall biosynthesis
LNIGIDARALGIKICGVSRVAQSLIQALGLIDKINSYVIYTNTLTEIPGLPANFHIVATGCNRMNALNDYRFYRFMLQNDLDLLHVMHSWLPLFIPRRVKKLVTVHDIFTVTDPNFFAKRRPLHWIFRCYFWVLTWLTVVRTDVIITISRYCVEEIKRVFNLKDKRFEIVYNSPGIVLEGDASRNVVMGDQEYIFYLGNFRSYKNVPTLIEGYAHFLKSTGQNVELVLAGNDNCTQIKALCAKLGIADRVHFFYRPTDEYVDNLYRNARAFIFPSLYEGFGIPPIEAMSYGVPVIISDAAALMETSGGAALVFDKTSPEDLAAKISLILNNADLRDDLVRRGYKCANSYTWENSAKQLKSVYESIMGE